MLNNRALLEGLNQYFVCTTNMQRAATLCYMLGETGRADSGSFEGLRLRTKENHAPRDYISAVAHGRELMRVAVECYLQNGPLMIRGEETVRESLWSLLVLEEMPMMAAVTIGEAPRLWNRATLEEARELLCYLMPSAFNIRSVPTPIGVVYAADLGRKIDIATASRLRDGRDVAPKLFKVVSHAA